MPSSPPPSIRTAPSHVALLVPSVRRAAAFLHPYGLSIGKEAEFPGEGTREIYVNFGMGNSLLLVEPAGPGPYQRAMEKRGPGLHHLAVDVLDLEEFLAALPGSGWSLHPVSADTIKRTRTAWLFRRGFHGLVEVQERASLLTGPLFVSAVQIPGEGEWLRGLMAPLQLQEIVTGGSREMSLVLEGRHSVKVADLIR